MERIKIGILEKLGYGSFTVSVNIISQFVSTFILFYYTDVFGLSPALAGIVLAIGVIWDGVNDPLIAFIADNRRFKNGELARPYMLYICVPLAIITVLVFTPVDMPMYLKATYAVLLYLVFDTLSTLLRLPSYTLSTLATPDQQDRLSINTFVSGGATLGAVLAGVLCWPLVRTFSGLTDAGELINPQRGFPIAAAVIGLVIIAGSLFSYFTSKERVKPKNEVEDKMPLLRSFKLTLSNYNFRWNTAFSTLYFVNNALMTTSLVYYCTYVFRDSGAVTLIMAVFAIGSLVALPAVKKINNVLGRRKAMMLGAGLILVSKIPFVIFPLNIIAMYVYAFVTGLSVALNIVAFSTTRAEVADHIEFVNNRRIDSMVINFMGFFNKCGTSLSILFIGLILEWTGYQANLSVQPPSVTTALIIIMGWAPIILSAVMLLCGAKITIEKVLEEMKGDSNV